MTTKTKALALLVGAEAIGKAIVAIGKAGAKLDQQIQQAGLSILKHIDQHSNVTLLGDLWHAMPKGARKNALAEWALAHGKVMLNTDPLTKKDKPFLYDKARTTNIDKAIEHPWYTFKPEVAVDQVFDFGAQLLALLNKAGKAASKGQDVQGVELLAQVRALIPAEPVKA